MKFATIKSCCEPSGSVGEDQGALNELSLPLLNLPLRTTLSIQAGQLYE